MVPAADQATLGYSVRLNAFTDETVALALNDPLEYLRLQSTTLVEDSVLTFAHQIKPMGLTLGDGQARMIMPRIDGHPKVSDWSLPYNPDDPGATQNIATREELILAAVTTQKLMDPTWRGLPSQLDDAFVVDPGGDDSCAALTQEVADRIAATNDGFATMSALDLGRDYFPHGGLIFGGQLELPKFISELPPQQFYNVLTLPNDLATAQAWLTDAQFVFENYLTATNCVGQLAGYLPAPNPPDGFDFDTSTPQDFIDSLVGFDYNAWFNGQLASEIYPADQILMNGWLDAEILGMPTLRGYTKYDRGTQGVYDPSRGAQRHLAARLCAGRPAVRSAPPALHRSDRRLC